MKVDILKQFSIFLPNRPGALSRLTKILCDAGVNVVGVASEVRDDSGVVRLAVGGEVDISSLLTQNGFSSIETRLLSVHALDKPGELYRIARALADGKVNITTVYGTAVDGQHSRILMAVENTDKARAILEVL
jgi:hypothetical protein